MEETYRQPIIRWALGLILNCLCIGDGVAVEVGQFTHDRSARALLHAYTHLSPAQEELFFLGRSLTNVPWVIAPASTTARDGLGPLFNANSCVACHQNNGAGQGYGHEGQVPPSTVLQLHYFNADTQQWQGDPHYGAQMAINGTQNVPFESTFTITWQTSVSQPMLAYPKVQFTQLNYGDLTATTQWQLLRAPSLVGLGLLEQIPDAQILAKADAQERNKDGISGRAHQIWSHANNTLRPGRFGWKANVSSLVEQIAKAANMDMGLTNPLFVKQGCTLKQTACNEAYRSQELDLPSLRLKAMHIYLAHLQAPMPRQTLRQTQQLFNNLGCQQCHSNDYTTANGQSVPAYTDLLLHEMGPELAGQGAMAREWRTAPLWGLGLRTHNGPAAFLHDGRARTLHEAILWHGGEAKVSRQAYTQLSTPMQQQLIYFLEAL